MASMNKVLLIGNLTRDPEVRYTPSGSAVMQLRLAINRRFKDRDGNWRDNTVFLDVEVWGRQAEALSSVIKKGWSIFVDGQLKMDEWTSKDGTKRSKLVVTALGVNPISQPQGASRQAQQNKDAQPKQPTPEPAEQSDAPAEQSDAPAAQQHDENIVPDEEDPPF